MKRFIDYCGGYAFTAAGILGITLLALALLAWIVTYPWM